MPKNLSTATLPYPHWQTALQELVSKRYDSTFVTTKTQLREAILARLRIMAPTDVDERRALEEALNVIDTLEE
jgi:hypothetical protein